MAQSLLDRVVEPVWGTVMPQRWEDSETVLFELAEIDLQAGEDVVPTLIAFSGDEGLFIAGVRPFPKGEYAEPLIELLTLAAALDADRLALSLAGRAWSLEDPVPPVSADGDLRQRVLMLHVVDAAADACGCVTVLHPFELTAGGPSWSEPARLDEGAGWVIEALTWCAQARLPFPGDDRELYCQAARLVGLGHELHLSPRLAARLTPAGAS